LKWLSEKVPAFGDLSDLEKMAILDFALLWTFFESRCLTNDANMKRIRKFAQKLPEVIVTSCEVEKIAVYFRARYRDNGEFSERYHRLNLEKAKMLWR
jgi:hypothetical protein